MMRRAQTLTIPGLDLEIQIRTRLRRQGYTQSIAGEIGTRSSWKDQTAHVPSGLEGNRSGLIEAGDSDNEFVAISCSDLRRP